MAAEIRGVDQRSSRRIEFRDEPVCGSDGIGTAGIETACPVGLKGAGRCGKVSRVGSARHISVTGSVYRDRVASVAAAAPEVRGVGEHRVDHQRPSAIVYSDL